MKRAALPITMAAGAVVALPAAAAADVDVPRAFLGGPIAPPIAVRTTEPAGGPSRSPTGVIDGCAGESPAACAVVGADADLEVLPLPRAEDGPGDPGLDTPEVDPADPDLAPEADAGGAVETARRPRSRVVAPPPTRALRAAFGRLRAPAPAAWLPWQRPTLRWKAAPGVTHHNVQVFRGERRILNAWTRGAALRAPEGSLRQGRTYVWTVFPGFGPRRDARFGPALGRSTFEVTLRPRLVFRRPGGRRGVVAEIRPHVPHAKLRLTAPRALGARVPGTVTINRRGRFALPLTKRQAERLGARLLSQGTDPPIGLRG